MQYVLMKTTGYLLSLLVLAIAPIVPAAHGYEGHGSGSVDAETIKKFAPTALPPEITRRVQAAFDVRSPGGGMLTNDGRKLFFSWNVTGIWQVWRLDGPKQFPVQMTGGEDPTTVAGLTPNDKFLIVSRDHGGEEYPGLYLQPVAGGPLAVVQHKPKVRVEYQFTSDDSHWLYYAANDVKADSFALYRFDLVKRGEAQRIFEQDGTWSIADHRGADELLLVKATGNMAREIFLYNVTTRKLTPLLGQGEDIEYDVAFGANANELLVLTNKLSDFRRLYRWNLLKPGTAGNTDKFVAITPELGKDVSEFAMDRAHTHLYYTVNDGGYFRLRVLAAKTYAPLKLPSFADADMTVLGTLSRNGRYAIVRLETARMPKTNYVFDWQTKKLVQWVLPSSPEIDTGHFAAVSLESFPARDGARVPMFVRRPAECSAPGRDKPCPVIVIFHGGPESQAHPGFNATYQLFVDAGFIVVEPNVRGSDGYGKAYLDSDNGPKRLNVITDIQDCSTLIKTHWKMGTIIPKIGVMGWSYGGYSTLYAMTRFAGAFNAGVGLVGMADLRTFLANTAPYRRKLRAAEYGDLQKDAEALKQLSPVTYLDQIKDPLLIIQGANDPRVPAGEALQMFEAARKHGQAELILFADEGHGAGKRENRVFEIGHTLRFFERYLK